MPPPNVTGSLHIGHALTYTLQDIWIRAQRLLGHQVLAQPGLDHAGIATQMVVEKDLEKNGSSRHAMGRKKFVDYALSFKEKTGQTIVHQMKQLGMSAHWDRLRFTLDPDIQKTVRHVFVSLYQEGLIYQSCRMVHFDPKLQTALSNLEVQHQEEAGTLWSIRYIAAKDPSQYLTVATTRPETLFGDVAVAVHPQDARYQAWIGQKVCVPLTGKEIPVIADSAVQQDKGTGVLKITPAHDFLDYEIGQRHHLPSVTVINKKGCLNKDVPGPFVDLSVKEARALVLETLKKEDLLLDDQPTKHLVPKGDRSGATLQPTLTTQWFLNTKPLAKKALETLEKNAPSFAPDHYKNTYKNWLNIIEPWCLSRQLWWGHQLPVWYGPDQKVFVAESYKEALLEAKKFYGKDVDLVQDPDVLDTWFSSALWPLVTLGWPNQTQDLSKFYPTTLLVTGFDIIFFWVARMVMLCTHFTGQVPFKQVYIHGLVRDAQRQKMSKTKGNVVNPLDVLDVYGADPLRFSLALKAYSGKDVAFSQNAVQLSRNFLTKLWNAGRFCVEKGCLLTNAENTLPDAIKHPINAWIVSETQKTIHHYKKALEDLSFSQGSNLIYHFLWDVFCDFYIEFMKSMLGSDDSALAEETQNVSAWAFGQCLFMLHPFVPFTTSELWSYMAPTQKPLHQSFWAVLKQKDWAPDLLLQAEKIIAWTKTVRRLRAFFSLPFKTSLTIHYQPDPMLSSQKWLLEEILNVKFLETDAQEAATGFQGILFGHAFYIPLEGLVDLAEEKTKLEKKADKIKEKKQMIEKRLSDPSFINKALAEKIKESEESLQQLTDEHALLLETIKGLT